MLFIFVLLCLRDELVDGTLIDNMETSENDLGGGDGTRKKPKGLMFKIASKREYPVEKCVCVCVCGWIFGRSLACFFLRWAYFLQMVINHYADTLVNSGLGNLTFWNGNAHSPHQKGQLLTVVVQEVTFPSSV